MAANLQLIISAVDKASGTLDSINNKSGGLGKTMGTVMKAGVLAGGTAVIGATAALIKFGTEFENAYNTIITGTGASGKALEGLKHDFKEALSKTPADMQSVATATADLNTRLGLTGKPLQDMTLQFVELSRITKTDVATNIKDVTRLFGDWSVSTDDQAGALDRLFMISQSTGIGVDRLSQLVVQFGAPLRGFGFTLDESTAILAKFEKEGVNTEAVMAGLKIGLGKVAAAGKDPATELAKVSEKIKAAGSAGEANIAAIEMFGSRAGPDMAAAIREGRFDVEAFIAQMDAGGATILETAAATMTWQDKLKLLKNRVLVALEPLMMKVVNALGAFATILLDRVIPAIEKWWKENGPGIMASLKEIGGYLAAFFAPALDTLADLWDNLKGPMKAVGEFLMEHKPLLIAVAAAVLLLVAPWLAVVAAIAVVLAKWDEISAFFTDLGKDIKAFVDGVIKKVSDFPIVGEIIKDEVRMAKIYVETQLKIIKALFQAAVDSITNIFKFWKAVFSGDWDGAWNALKDQFGVIMDLLSNLFGIALDAVKKIFDSKLRMVKGIGEDLGKLIVNAAKKVWEDLKHKFGEQVNAVATWLSGATGVVTAIGTSLGNLILAGAGAIWGTLVTAFSTAINAVATWLSGATGAVTAIGTSLGNLILAGADAVWSLLWDSFSRGVNNIANWVEGAWPAITAIGTRLGNLILAGAGAVWGTLSTAFSTAVNTIATWVEGSWNAIKAIGSSLANAIKEGVTGGLNGIISVFETFINAIIRKWNELEFSMSDPTGILGALGLPSSFTIGTPDIPLVRIDRLQKGAWNIPRDQLAFLHAGEMVVPRHAAEYIRGGGGGITVYVAVNTPFNLYHPAEIEAAGDRLAEVLRRKLR